jgi:dipeptidyl aminopeptidase/acylaminoacyl peptidase
MFEHLDDPNPPLPRELMVELVVAEGARRRRRRAAVAGGMAATLLVLAGGVRLSHLGGAEGSLDVKAEQPTVPSPDSRGEGGESGDELATTPGPTDPVSTPPNSEASAPPGTTTFAGLTKDQQVVLGDAETGAVTKVLVEAPQDGSHVGPDVALSPDRRTVYYVASTAGDAAADSEIYEVATGGGTPTFLVTGSDPAVSPDGSSLAYVLDSTAVVLRDIDTGQERSWASAPGSEYVIHDLTFTDDGQALAFTAAPPDEPAVLYALDLLRLSSVTAGGSLNDAGRLGPPEDAPTGTGWSTPDHRSTDHLIGVVETCCALGAGGYDGNTSFAFIDPTTAQSPESVPVTGGSGTVVMAKYDISGQHQLVLTADEAGTTSLFRGDDGQLEPLEQAPQFTAIDW